MFKPARSNSGAAACRAVTLAPAQYSGIRTPGRIETTPCEAGAARHDSPSPLDSCVKAWTALGEQGNDRREIAKRSQCRYFPIEPHFQLFGSRMEVGKYLNRIIELHREAETAESEIVTAPRETRVLNRQ